MSDAQQLRCPRCGAPRPADGTWTDLCPACLLGDVLDVDDGPCPYAVIAPMAEDAGGVTYLAHALRGTRNHVALKIYHPRTDTTEVLGRYHRWRPRLAAFEHPHATRLLAVGLTDQQRLFKAMEFAIGSPLPSSARVPTGQALDELPHLVACQLASAFTAAHAAGLRHHDFGPSRVRVSHTPSPHAFILGFGTRLVIDGVGGDGVSGDGPSEPAAGEAARRDHADMADDVQALAATIRSLGIVLPQPSYRAAAEIAADLATLGSR